MSSLHLFIIFKNLCHFYSIFSEPEHQTIKKERKKVRFSSSGGTSNASVLWISASVPCCCLYTPQCCFFPSARLIYLFRRRDISIKIRHATHVSYSPPECLVEEMGGGYVYMPVCASKQRFLCHHQVDA